MYQQSERSKWVQGALHLGTVGRCTTVHKCAAFLFNDSDSLALAQRIWPDAVMMDDFGDVVIRKLGGCELARCKIRKGHYTYVKKEGAKSLRKASWDHMLTTIAGMDDIADWGRICAEILGQFTKFSSF